MIEVNTRAMKNLLKPHLPVTEYGLFVEMCKELEALRAVAEAARKLKPLQPSEVKLGEFLVEGWPDLILALRKLDEERRG